MVEVSQYPLALTVSSYLTWRKQARKKCLSYAIRHVAILCCSREKRREKALNVNLYEMHTTFVCATFGAVQIDI